MEARRLERVSVGGVAFGVDLNSPEEGGRGGGNPP
jgi:hypothetical protein